MMHHNDDYDVFKMYNNNEYFNTFQYNCEWQAIMKYWYSKL